MDSSCLHQNDDKFIPILENIIWNGMVCFLKLILLILPQAYLYLFFIETLKTNITITHPSLKCNKTTIDTYQQDIYQWLETTRSILGLIVNSFQSQTRD